MTAYLPLIVLGACLLVVYILYKLDEWGGLP